MPDSPNWLTVEQREELLSLSSYTFDDVDSLVRHAAEADRREAELRKFEKLAYMLDALTGAPLHAPATEPEHMAEVLAKRFMELRDEQERLISVGHEWATIALQRNVDINELQKQLAAKDAEIARAEFMAEAAGEQSRAFDERNGVLVRRNREVEQESGRLRAALEALPLEDFNKDMDKIDAADFVDHSQDFFRAMELAREALAAIPPAKVDLRKCSCKSATNIHRFDIDSTCCELHGETVETPPTKPAEPRKTTGISAPRKSGDPPPCTSCGVINGHIGNCPKSDLYDPNEPAETRK